MSIVETSSPSYSLTMTKALTMSRRHRGTDRRLTFKLRPGAYTSAVFFSDTLLVVDEILNPKNVIFVLFNIVTTTCCS